MTEEKLIDPTITNEDKLLALLAYIFTPTVPIILLLLENKKDRPFLKAHYPQALLWGLVLYIGSFVFSFIIVGICFGVFGLVMNIVWGIKAYNGEYVEIPVITKFVKDQGWAK